MTKEATLKDDNWGYKARIGLFIVGNEAIPEAEWWAMAPHGVSVHAARVTASTPWARWHENRTEVDLADDLLRGAKQFAAMRLTAATVGHTSSSVVGGKGWDDATAKSLSAVLGAGIKVTTNGLDTLAALAASKVKQPFLVLPPWFPDDTVKAAVRYYILSFLHDGGKLDDPNIRVADAASALAATIAVVDKLGVGEPAKLDAIATNGRIMLALRRGRPMWARQTNGIADCKLCSEGNRQEPRRRVAHDHVRASMVACEPDKIGGDWEEVPDGTIVTIARDLTTAKQAIAR